MARPQTSPSHAQRAAAAPPAWREASYLILHLAGFSAVTLLLTWGVIVLALLALGGFSLDGVMAQLGNLAGRYVQAPPARVAAFKAQLATAHLVLSAGLVLLRCGRLLAPFRARGSRHA